MTGEHASPVVWLAGVPRYAPVGPLAGLRALDQSHLLGTYHLLIAPIVLEANAAYNEFFTRQHPDLTVILDNGVIELGYPLDVPSLAVAARAVNASVVVLPDTIDDRKFTIKQARHAHREYRKLDGDTPLMGVVQGRTFEECLECAEQLVDIGVDWLAVPRGLTKNLDTRVPLVRQIATEHQLPIHVLGFSDNIEDDIKAAASHPLVQGIDAATPMWANQWLPLHPPENEPGSLGLGKRPVGFWHQAIDERAGHNVETARRWLHAATLARIEREGPADQTGR